MIVVYVMVMVLLVLLMVMMVENMISPFPLMMARLLYMILTLKQVT